LTGRIIHDVNTLKQVLKAMANLRLSERIEILSTGGGPDVQRIPTRMNMAGVKLKETQMDQEDSFWLTTRMRRQ
jgi:TusA-related sulfurtransferase